MPTIVTDRYDSFPASPKKPRSVGNFAPHAQDPLEVVVSTVMADRDSGAKRGLFRRGARADAAAPSNDTPVATPIPRRERRSSGEMFTTKPANNFDDPWSSDAWAEDGWNDEWADPKSRASIRPAAAPRSADVDAWLESDQTEFADVTADIARKWVPDTEKGRGATWDEPETPVFPHADRVDIDPPTPDESTIKVVVAPVEAPKVEIPRFETPKADVPEVDVPKIDVPKIDVPKIDVPKIDVPEVDVPKIDVPKIDVPKFEFPKPAPEAAHAEQAEPDAHPHETPKSEAPFAAPGIVMTPKAEPIAELIVPTLAPKAESTAPVDSVAEAMERSLSWIEAPKTAAPSLSLDKTDAEPKATPNTSREPAASTVPVLPVGATWDAEPSAPTPTTPTPNTQSPERSAEGTSTIAHTPPASLDDELSTDLEKSLRDELDVTPNTPMSVEKVSDSASFVTGSGWDDEPDTKTWKDDPVVRSLDDDFVHDVTGRVSVDRSVPLEAERRSVPRSVQHSIVPDEYDDLDRSLDLDLAEELDNELPTFVRHERKGLASPGKAKARKHDPLPTPKRAPIGTTTTSPVASPMKIASLDTAPMEATRPSTRPEQATPMPVEPAPVAAISKVVLDDDTWDDVDPNALAASRLDEQLADRPGAVARTSGVAKPLPRAVLKPRPVEAAVAVSDTTRNWSPAPTNATDLATVRLLMTSGLGLAALAVLRLVLALVATIKASTDTNGFGDRLVDAANNLGTEQAVLLVLAVTFAILGRYVAHGRIESVNRLTGRACGVILGAASATLLLAVAKLMNNLGVDGATFESSSQAAVEFLAVGGISLVAIAAAWSTSAQ
jgi:hypothetical protein